MAYRSKLSTALLVLLVGLLGFVTAAATQARDQLETRQTTTPAIDNTSTKYKYVGCYNETTGLSGTSGQRALSGIMESLPGSMTVQRCLAYCADANFKYAGLEYAQ
jgi:hypothetical protein